MTHRVQFSFKNQEFLPHALPNCGCEVDSSVRKLGKSLRSNLVLKVQTRKFSDNLLALDDACMQFEERLPRIPLGRVRVKRCCPLLAWIGHQKTDNNNKHRSSLTAAQGHALHGSTRNFLFMKDLHSVNSTS